MSRGDGFGRGGPMRRIVRAAYRLALCAFPSAHRARYGNEMLDAFDRELDVRRAHGAGSPAAYVARACADALSSGLGERRRRRHGPSGPSVFTGAERDLLQALRGLTKSWTYTLVCVCSLSTGLGVAMAVYMLVRATIEPPFELDEQGLVELFVRDDGRFRETWSYPDFRDVSESLSSLGLVASATSEGTLRLIDGEPGRRVRVAYVSPEYFRTLGLPPVVGRDFRADDVLAGTVPVVLAHHVWERWLTHDPAVIGRELGIDRSTHVVVGIAPRNFRYHHVGSGVDVFVPLARHPDLAASMPRRFDRGAAWLGVLGRAPRSMTDGEVTEMVEAVMTGLAREHPETNAARTAVALPYGWQGARTSATDGLVIRGIFGGVQGIVLLIVCLNLAGMVLVRSATRERELALRLAIGSSRRRLVQYLMMESLAIGVGGGVLVLGVLGTALWVLSLRLGPLPQSVAIDAGVVTVCIGLSVAAACVFGLAPALRFSKPSLLTAMRDDAGGGGRRSGRLHRVAVAAQIALSVPVLIVAGSVTQGARSMTTADFGLDADGLLVAAPSDLSPQGYDPPAVRRLARALRADLIERSGVRGVSVSDHTPLDGIRSGVGVADPARGTSTGGRISRVDERFFETLGIPILRGRAFETDDVEGSEPVAVLTAGLAARIFEGDDPLGARIELRLEEGGVPRLHTVTVVGVAAEVAGPFLESDTDNVFLPYWQSPSPVLAVAVRSASVDDGLASALEEAVLALDPELARPTVASFSSMVEARGRDFPVWSVFFTVVSGLLLLLSALGIYGIVAFAVARRTREIGVRMSLGSTRRRVLKSVLRDALKLALPGLVFGGLVGVLVGQAILNRMYVQIGLPLADARIVIAAGLVALVMVLAASFTPARRAASVDPMQALRAD